MKEINGFNRFYYRHEVRAINEDNEKEENCEITKDEYLRRRQALISLGISFIEKEHPSWICLCYYTRDLND